MAVAIFPFLFAVRLSFTNASTMNFANPSFVGLKNYVDVLTSNVFWQSTWVSVVYVAAALTLEVGLGLMLAVAADKSRGEVA